MTRGKWAKRVATRGGIGIEGRPKEDTGGIGSARGTREGYPTAYWLF